MKKQSGTLKRWDDARGFGSIVDRKGRDIFVHVTAFGKIRSRPKDGDKVLFRVEPDAAKGVRAIDVERCWRPAHLLLPEFLLPLLVVAVFYGAFWLFFSKNAFWVFLSPLLIFIAVLTFIMFGLDKRAALNAGRRLARRPVGAPAFPSQDSKAALPHYFLAGSSDKYCPGWRICFQLSGRTSAGLAGWAGAELADHPQGMGMDKRSGLRMKLL